MEKDTVQSAIDFAVNGLLTDSAHHKQWYLERILLDLGVDLVELRRELIGDGGGYDWEPGIAP